MCLNHAKKIQLEEDITVYKFLIERLGGFCFSPYYPDRAWVPDGPVVFPDGDMDVVPCDFSLLGYYYIVHGGAYHSYGTLRKAVNKALNYAVETAPLENIVIGEFVIPKESVVYANESDELASDRIRFVRLVGEDAVGDVPVDHDANVKEWTGKKLYDIINESKGTD